eukprot:SAG11_NODE_9819_length_878_cov_1.863928_1_plen_97_part_00
MGLKMEDGKLTASGGLAPARCPGLITSLLSPCLAASGAGKVAVQGAAEQKFAAAKPAACTKRASFFLDFFVCTRFSGASIQYSPDTGQYCIATQKS